MYHKRPRDAEQDHLSHSLILSCALKWQTTPYRCLGLNADGTKMHHPPVGVHGGVPSAPCLQPCDRLTVCNTGTPPSGNLAAPAKKAGCFARRGLRLTKDTGAKRPGCGYIISSLPELFVSSTLLDECCLFKPCTSLPHAVSPILQDAFSS